MALIKCKECGSMISDRATKCPKCGCPTTKEEEKPDHIEVAQPIYYEHDDNGKSRKWLYVLIVFLLLILVGGGFYYFYYNHQKQEAEDREKFVKDSINQARQDSINQARQDSINQVRQDSIKRAKLAEVGTLSAYYAKADFGDYKKGQLICDSNDPINRIVDYNATHYKYEGDDTGEYYSYLLPKSKIEKRTYTMCQLPVSMVGKRIVFVSKEGDVAKLFASNINNHKYWDYSGDSEVMSWEETDKHGECYVISVQYSSGYLFEEPLEERGGNIRLYRENRYDGGGDPNYCRYRKGEIGIIEDDWVIKGLDNWPERKSAYDEAGRLMVDQCKNDGIPEYMSIAFLPALDALYIDGDLYYRKK